MISNVPLLLNEVDSFFKRPMKKFKFRFPANRYIYIHIFIISCKNMSYIFQYFYYSNMGLSPNPVMSIVYNQLPREINALNHLTASSISLHYLHSEMKWQSNIKKICSEIILNYDLPIGSYLKIIF